MGGSNSKKNRKYRNKDKKEQKCLDSFELVGVELGINGESNDCDSIEISEISDSVAVKVNQRYYNGIRKFEISNFLSNVFEVIKVLKLKNISQSSDIFFMNFQTQEEISLEQHSKDFDEIAIIYENNPVIIIIESNVDNKTSIYWKPKILSKFLCKSHSSELKFDDNRKLNSFIVQFLLDSIKNDYIGLHSSYFIKPEANTIEIHLLADFDDHNLLLLAAKQGNAEIVRILLELGMSTNLPDSNINAQELALKNKNYDVILELVYGNLTYPVSIDMKECSGKLMDFYENVENLHKFVRTNAVDKVKEILNQFPEQIYFYNSSNESVLKVAILSSSIAAYEYLLSRKMKFGPHEDPEELYQHLNNDEKRIIREIHNKFTQHSPKKHLNILMANSFICHDEIDVEEKIKRVQNAYKALNSNILVRIILMIVAASKNFKIIFDFNRESVSVADPTVDSYTQGLFYPMGRIYIGAKQLLNEVTENETLGNLAHELCHFAMNLVYRNNANPYTSNDNQAIQEFEKIYEECKKNAESEDIIGMVYDHYQSDMQHAELIVRVVHMLMYYRNNLKKLDENRTKFEPLFEFYEKKIFPELENALPEIESRLDKEMEKHIKKASKFKKIAFIGIGLCIALLVIATTIGVLLYPPRYEFSKLSASQKLKVQNSLVDYRNVTVKFKELFADNSPAYETLISDHISEMLNGNILDLQSQHLIYLNDHIFLDWKNLTKKLKDKILESDFDFQGENVKFKNFDGQNFTVLSVLSSYQIKYILDDQKIKVGKMEDIKNFKELYVERKFVRENEKSAVLSFEDVLELRLSNNSFILSADSGLGKTVTFKVFTNRIKHKYPNRWVIYSDLKDLAKYNYNHFRNTELLLIEFLGLNFLTVFEITLFRDLYKYGNVIFLWNGLDEVGKDQVTQVLTNLRSIKENTQNTQFVCSRRIYVQKLKEYLSEISYTFAPLDENDQRIFLMKLIASNGVNDTEKISEYTTKVLTIIQKIEPSNGEANSFSDLRIPLILEMIAELVINNVENSENIYFVFEKYIDKKMDIWRSKFTVESRSFVRERNFNILEIFHKYAVLNELLSHDKSFEETYKNLKLLHQKIPNFISKDEISKQGILYLTDDNEFQFVHRTFGEFFIAQYFIDNIYAVHDVSPEEAELRLRLFYEVNRRYGKSQTIITDFMSSYLQIQEKNGDNRFDSTISQLLKNKFQKILFHFLEQQNSKIMKFLLQFFSKDPNVLRELLQINSSETLYEASFKLPDIGNQRNQIQEIIKNSGKMFLEPEDYEKFINVSNIISISLFNNQTLNFDYLKNLFKGMEKNELDQIFIMEYSPIFDNRIFCYDFFWEIVADNFTKVEQKLIISNIFKSISKVQFDDYLLNEHSSFVLKKIEEIMTDSEIYLMFQEERFLQKTTRSVSTHKILWNFVIKHANELQQNELMKFDQYEFCRIDESDFAFGIDDCYFPTVLNFTDIYKLYYKINYYFER